MRGVIHPALPSESPKARKLEMALAWPPGKGSSAELRLRGGNLSDAVSCLLYDHGFG